MQQPIDGMILSCIVLKDKQTISELLKKLSADSTNFIAVVDEEGRAVGVATENDLLKLLKLQPIAGVQAVVTDDFGAEIFGQKVSDIMARDPLKVKKNATAKDVLGMMTSNNLRSILVVDDENRPLGYVRLSDVMKRMARE